MAITTAMGESFGIKIEISEIKFADRIMMIRAKGNLVFVLVTKNRSQFLSNALKRFSEEFIQIYREYDSKPKVHKIIQNPTIASIMRSSFGLPFLN